MEDYNLRLDKEVFPKWKAELKEKEEAPLLDTNGEPIFTCDGIMWKNNVSKEELYNSWEKSDRRILFLLKDQPSKTMMTLVSGLRMCQMTLKTNVN